MSEIGHASGQGMAEAIRALATTGATETRTIGTVTKVDSDGTAWVRVEGATASAPYTRTAVKVEVGDEVSVTIRNNRGYIDGNYARPATDDEVALQARETVTGIIENPGENFKELAETMQGVIDIQQQLPKLFEREKVVVDGNARCKIVCARIGFVATININNIPLLEGYDVAGIYLGYVPQGFRPGHFVSALDDGLTVRPDGVVHMSDAAISRLLSQPGRSSGDRIDASMTYILGENQDDWAASYGQSAPDDGA